MLSFLDHPQTLEVGDPLKDDAELKLVYFFGAADAIDVVVAKRRADKSCRQLPHDKEFQLPSAYHVRVFYLVGLNGVSVKQIDVQFDSKWTCFYEKNERVGTCDSCHGNFHRHFLETDDCVISQIRRYERSRIIARLAKLNPGDLLDIVGQEEADERDFSFEAEDED